MMPEIDGYEVCRRLTKMPGNNSVAARINQALSHNENVCVIYSDLDNFKAFNDKYGFALGDDVMMYTSQVLKDATLSINDDDAFIGHIGGDDFVVVVPSDRAQATADAISHQFDEGIVKFYNPEDAAAKCIQSINRKGEKQIFPLMSISMAGVDLSHGCYEQYIEVNDACAEVKKIAKGMPGGAFALDRRRRK